MSIAAAAASAASTAASASGWVPRRLLKIVAENIVFDVS